LSENSQFLGGAFYRLQDSIQILRDIVIPEPKLGHAAALQPGGSLHVAIFLDVVLAAVEFDREAQLGTIEIKNVRPGWMLAAKTQPIQASVAQPSPEALFHFGGCLA
jgi:hypothetical protein